MCAPLFSTYQVMSTNMVEFRVLTLNCWGVPVFFACKKRKERIPAIAEAVAKSNYDIVAFQEIWHKGDFAILKKTIGQTLPYSHYYYSGTIGSGLCVFSKWPIIETLYHKFDPNGYPHKVQHGDWFGGKGVGLAKIRADTGTLIHLYVTHLHAEYLRMNDEYLAHRVSQAFNMSQFIKLTNAGADLVLACGDFNLEPVDLGYKILRTNTCLQDAWLNKKSTTTSDKDGNTCECSTNSFSENKGHQPKRIDYILYSPGIGCSAEIKECSVTMCKVPGKTFNFSDHEGVEAVISLDTTANPVFGGNSEELVPLLEEAHDIVCKGLTAAAKNQNFFVLFAVITLLLAYFISVVHIPYPLDFFVTIFQLLLVLATGFGITHTFITIRCEVHGLETAREDVQNVLNYLRESM